jgi:hypothetical protein
MACQQHPFGLRVQLMRVGQELDPGHLTHLMIDDEQRHRRVLARQFTQDREPGRRRRLADHPEIRTEPPAEVVAERVHDPRIIVDHEQYRV